MTHTNQMQKPSFGIGLAFCGILLSIILGISSMLYYSSAKSSYQSEMKETGKEMSSKFMSAGQDYASDIYGIGSQATDDISNGTADFGSYMEQGADAADTAFSKGQQAISDGAESMTRIQEKFKRNFIIISIINYLALLTALVSCVYGIIQIQRLSKSSAGAIPGKIFLQLTFGVFGLATLISVSSPIGLSYRYIIADDEGETLTKLSCIAAMLLFIAGWVLWFIGNKKLNGAYPQYKSAYIGALLLFCCLGAFPVPVILFLVAFYCIIKGWMTANRPGRDNVSTVTQVFSSSQTETASVKMSVPAPTSNVTEPSQPKIQANAQSRTLTIVIAVAAVIIIGVLCAILFKSGNNQDQPQNQVVPVEAKQTVDETENQSQESPAASSADGNLGCGEYELQGTIAGKNVEISLEINAFGNVSGAYMYTSSNSRDMIRLNGSYLDFSNALVIDEYYDDEPTGVWHLSYEGDNHLKGTFINAKGNSYPIMLVITSHTSYE